MQGDQFSPRVYLEDVYDGQEDTGGLLSGGLGLLSDGRVGGPLTFQSSGGLVSGILMMKVMMMMMMMMVRLMIMMMMVRMMVRMMVMMVMMAIMVEGTYQA